MNNVTAYDAFGLNAVRKGWEVVDYDDKQVIWQKGDKKFKVVFEGKFGKSKYDIVTL